MTMSDCIIPNRKPDGNGCVMIPFEGRYQGMHRVAYKILHGDLPSGMLIDHICHNESHCNQANKCSHRACINPEHLRAVTHLENVKAGKRSLLNLTNCKNGHDLSENLQLRPNGRRFCKACRKESNAGVRRTS